MEREGRVVVRIMLGGGFTGRLEAAPTGRLEGDPRLTPSGRLEGNPTAGATRALSSRASP